MGWVGPKDGVFAPTPQDFVLLHPRPTPHDGENFLPHPHPLRPHKITTKFIPSNQINF